MKIKKAMAPSQLDTAASRIAAVAAVERPITAPILRGVDREVTFHTLTELERQVQSLMSQMATLSSNGGSQFQAPAQAPG